MGFVVAYRNRLFRAVRYPVADCEGSFPPRHLTQAYAASQLGRGRPAPSSLYDFSLGPGYCSVGHELVWVGLTSPQRLTQTFLHGRRKRYQRSQCPYSSGTPPPSSLNLGRPLGGAAHWSARAVKLPCLVVASVPEVLPDHQFLQSRRLAWPRSIKRLHLRPLAETYHQLRLE